MIDTSGEYWRGSEPADIAEWLRAYSEEEALDVKPVVCKACGSCELQQIGDQDEGAVQIKCSSCGTKKLLLDSAEYWKEVSHRTIKCGVCKAKVFNVAVGFSRRANGQVRWVWLGSRCTCCHTLGSAFDWKIDYEPTDEMEKNI